MDCESGLSGEVSEVYIAVLGQAEEERYVYDYAWAYGS